MDDAVEEDAVDGVEEAESGPAAVRGVEDDAVEARDAHVGQVLVVQAGRVADGGVAQAVGQEVDGAQVAEVDDEAEDVDPGRDVLPAVAVILLVGGGGGVGIVGGQLGLGTVGQRAVAIAVGGAEGGGGVARAHNGGDLGGAGGVVAQGADGLEGLVVGAGGGHEDEVRGQGARGQELVDQALPQAEADTAAPGQGVSCEYFCLCVDGTQQTQGGWG